MKQQNCWQTQTNEFRRISIRFSTEYVQNSAENDIEKMFEKKYGKEFAKKAKVPVHRAITLTMILMDSALSAFSIPNTKDITIYNKINIHPEYLTVIEGLDGEVSMEDIINQVNQN